MYNRYRGRCYYCSHIVKAKTGKLLHKSNGQWLIAHLACADNEQPAVVSTYFPNTGNTVYRNARGRCEDAPCCGCCS